MPKAPWEREWLDVTPDQFERMVVDYLRALDHQLKDFTVIHQTPLASPCGEFKMDAVAKFEALGADFVATGTKNTSGNSNGDGDTATRSLALVR